MRKYWRLFPSKDCRIGQWMLQLPGYSVKSDYYLLEVLHLRDTEGECFIEKQHPESAYQIQLYPIIKRGHYFDSNDPEIYSTQFINIGDDGAFLVGDRIARQFVSMVLVPEPFWMESNQRNMFLQCVVAAVNVRWGLQHGR